MYCPEVSFFFQFSAFIMLMVTTLLCVAMGYWWDRNIKCRQPVKLRRPLKRGRKRK